MGLSVGGIVGGAAGFFAGGPAGAAAGYALGSGLDGSGDASDAASAGNRQAAKAQTKWNNKRFDLIKPWEEAGFRGLQGYEDLLNDPSSVRDNPGYQFAMNEGLRGLDSSSSARGMNLSGRGLRNVTRYGQNYASNQYDKSLSRYGKLADYGANAVGSLSGAYKDQGTNLSNMFMNQGQIDAGRATAPFNNLMSIGQLGLSAYALGGGLEGMFAGGAAGGGGGGFDFLNPDFASGGGIQLFGNS